MSRLCRPDVELAALAEIFSRAAGGRGACIVVAGEAGVGKTRLVSEAAAGARGRGQVVLVGRSTPTDRVSPLRPFGEAQPVAGAMDHCADDLAARMSVPVTTHPNRVVGAE